ncbi:sensor histidine kinase [Sabulicella rubraurantiaca]|uniref:sensor histidine kinase n=1 Tax=Sabulicella rubraurantiaca TaxID=2811429 RepID=UPI001A95A17F|nr:HWE histidine kinase domain-containing protein [Sabulicella rubraurantiaca]
MGNYLRSWFEPSAFSPHGFCLLWEPGLIWLHAVSDALVAVAYFSIPVALIAFLRRRRDFEFPQTGWLFAGFILLCGLTHMMGVVTLWQPWYWLEGLVKAATAIVSLLTAIVLWPLIPKALSLPSPSSMRDANDRLAREVEQKNALVRALEVREAELKELTASLERRVMERTESIAQINRRFDAALSAADVTVFTQDEKLAYTWISKPELGLTVEEIIGRTDEELMGDAALPIVAVKRRVLATGKPERMEAKANGQWWQMSIEKLHDAPGIICGAIEITSRKRDEARIRFLFDEVKHRVGNLLAIAQAILRQTAASCETVDEVVERFGLRLRALGGSHQLLVREGPRSANLREVIESQLGHHEASRFIIEGPEVRLDDAAVLHIGMALHELATNAVKFGALSVPGGMIRISWTEEDGQCTLRWREMGGPPVRPANRRGFGREVIEWAAAQAVNGEVSLDFPPEGLRWELRFPLKERKLAEDGVAHSAG